MAGALRDGLGGEEVHGSGAGMTAQNPFFTGSLTTGDGISGLNVFAAGSVVAGKAQAGQYTATGVGMIANVGSPYGMGLVVPMTARSNISGGTWVASSGGLAYAAPASTPYPVGMSVPGTNVASGGTVNVVINGIVPAISDGTIATALGAMVGAGAALNTVAPASAASGIRKFGVLNNAGSEGAVFIVL